MSDGLFTAVMPIACDCGHIRKRSVIGLTAHFRERCPGCNKIKGVKREVLSRIDRAFRAGFQQLCDAHGMEVPPSIDPHAIRFVRIHNRLPLPGEAPREALGFDTPIEGVSNYQAAIRNCSIDEPVTLLREPRNKHDKRAIAVISARGDTIGYLNSERWLARTILDEAHHVEAAIFTMGKAPERVNIGVEIDIQLLGAGTGPIGERDSRTWASLT